MNDKLVRFFEKINFIYNESDFFETEVVKVVVNKLDKSWNVYLKNPKPIKVDVIKELKIVCDKGIVDVSTIKLTFSYDNVDKVDVVNAVKSYILDLIKNSPSLGSLEESEIIIENNKINIEVTNKFEESVIEKESENIKQFLNDYGYGEFIF